MARISFVKLWATFNQPLAVLHVHCTVHTYMYTAKKSPHSVFHIIKKTLQPAYMCIYMYTYMCTHVATV